MAPEWPSRGSCHAAQDRRGERLSYFARSVGLPSANGGRLSRCPFYVAAAAEAGRTKTQLGGIKSVRFAQIAVIRRWRGTSQIDFAQSVDCKERRHAAVRGVL